MANLIYSAISSLDGYIEDVGGRFDWAEPDAEVHAFANELERDIGTHLYGRRMYETMAVWQTIGTAEEVGPIGAAYGEVWRGLDKVVFSRTLGAVHTPRTTLERHFDVEAIARLKQTAERDISVSGPGLAQAAFAGGLVDEIHLIVVPTIVGGGKAALPGQVRLGLELLDLQRFTNGTAHLHYRTR